MVDFAGVLGMNVACAQVQEPQSTTHQDQTVQGQEVQMQCPTNIRIGQTVTVQLESNPSTGYRWILVSPSEALQVSETEAVAIFTTMAASARLCCKRGKSKHSKPWLPICIGNMCGLGKAMRWPKPPLVT